jgi:hypothetical protein
MMTALIVIVRLLRSSILGSHLKMLGWLECQSPKLKQMSCHSINQSTAPTFLVDWPGQKSPIEGSQRLVDVRI